MGTPKLALRFRDAVPKISTIDEHRRVIREFGSVWWGWWKKSFEPDDILRSKSLSADERFEVYLVDRHKQKQFLAIVSEVVGPDSEPSNPGLIPSYYRQSQNKVHAWFRVSAIEEVDYLSDIAAAFGDATIVDLETAPPKTDTQFRTIDAVNKTKILHLSDLHFGADFRFLKPGSPASLGAQIKSLTDCIVSDLARLNSQNSVGAIVITGDITTQSDWTADLRKEIIAEFDALTQALGIDRSSIVALPGNHDVERYPSGTNVDPSQLIVDNQVAYDHEVKYRGFNEELTGVRFSAPLNDITKINLNNHVVYLCSLNSCAIAATKWTEYGYVGEVGWRTIEELKKIGTSKTTTKVLALHHHLLPIAEVEAPNSAGVSLTLDAANILDTAQEAGVSLALHGHQHKAKIARYETLTGRNKDTHSPLFVIANGSTGANKNRVPDSERNTYCLIEPHPDGPRVTLRELRSDAMDGPQLFDGVLN